MGQDVVVMTGFDWRHMRLAVYERTMTNNYKHNLDI